MKLPETPIQPSQQKTPFWQKTRKALRSLAAGGPEKPFDGREFCLQLAAATGASCVEVYDALSGIKPFPKLQEKISAGWKKNGIHRI